MTGDEERILGALAWMCVQYMSGKPVRPDEYGELDHFCEGAGELAVDVLVDYGLLEPVPRGGRWTEQGKALLART